MDGWITSHQSMIFSDHQQQQLFGQRKQLNNTAGEELAAV
jgi:hypothetical protein